jgi:hypothetical protein
MVARTRVPSQDPVAIPLALPEDEAQSLAQFVKRIDYETCVRFASVTWTYGLRAEADVMWSGVGLGC